MAIAFGILGLIIGAGIGEFWGALIGCIAGVFLGRWLKKTKPPEAAQAEVRAEPDAREAGVHAVRESLDDRVRALARRVSHLESEIVRLGGSVATPASAETVMRAEPGVVTAPSPIVEERPVAPEPVP